MIKAFVESFRFAAMVVLVAILVAFICLVWIYKWWILAFAIVYVLVGMSYEKITGRAFKFLHD